MSDDFEPFATAGSGKSDPEVAFDLLNKLKGQGVWGERNMPAILDMYAECLDAVKGLRAYEGQKRVEIPIQKIDQKAQQTQPQYSAPVSAAPQTPVTQPAVQTGTPPMPQAGHHPAPTANPVQHQQQQIQQTLQNRG